MKCDLPQHIEQVLSDFVQAARESFADNLRAVVLFGSGAEGQLRPTSDLNLILVLRAFEREQVDAFRKPLRVAHVAAQASPMFIVDTELPAAAEAFAVKFDDIARRRRVLYGNDPFSQMTPNRAATKLRLEQTLLNLILRLRERYAVVSLHPEQLGAVIAEAAGPLRVAAATLLELEGNPAPSPKEALDSIAASIPVTGWSQMRECISEARQARPLGLEAMSETLFQMLRLADAMRVRTERLHP